MTGIDLIHQILEIRPTLPALLASGSPGMTSEKVQQFGADALLSKPASLSALANIVHKALGIHRAR
jgi:CheY-like chemotaxis protein